MTFMKSAFSMMFLINQSQEALVVSRHCRIVSAYAQVLQLIGLALDLVAGGPDDAAGFVGELLGAPIWSHW